LLNAQQTLAAAQTGPTAAEITAAERAVEQADLSLKQAQLNQEANQLSLEQTQLNVAAAQQAVAGTTLTAPIDGTITAVNFSVGETVNGTALILADLAQPMLEVFLDESDLNMAGLGNNVNVVFDSLPDDTFSGRIVQVDPQLVTTNNVTAVRLVAQLDAASLAKSQTFPVGLNATVEVIGSQAQNAVLVPVEALREFTPGQFAVFVMDNGTPKLRFVTVGLKDLTSAEILSGVDAGEIVTTGTVQTP
jgi:multidrug efflux pump subunit AcrA (membrane-fusion protein)